jgi:WD40 repeat protein
LLEKIGEGGFGTVWAADQREPVRRRVALKVIKLGMDTQQVVARFEAERQALALMDHPNIAKALDAGATDSGRPYFVMELVRGIPITDYCDQNHLTPVQRLELFVKVCHAIQHAHQKGIIHRDIKPSNILVTMHDGVPVPKVIDFGIAKATQQQLTEKTIYTQLHQFIGTPAYVSPEQLEMSGLDIDTRSDIYSLGVLLYELLVGTTPFDAKQLMASGLDEMRRVIREKEPTRPSSKLGTLQGEELTTAARRRGTEPTRLINLLRGDLDWIAMKCLEKDRTRRYETASGLAMDIQRHLNDEPILAHPPSTLYRFQKLVRRYKMAVASGAVVVVALVFGLFVSTWQAVRALHAEREQGRLRQEAELLSTNEARLRERAEKSEDEARRRNYAAEMAVAFQAVADNNLSRAVVLLDRQKPRPGEEDLRGFEWRYLWRLSQNQSLASFPWGAIESIDISPDGRLIAIGSSDKEMNTVVRDLRSHEVIASLPGRAWTLSFSSRRDLLATGHEESVALWDIKTWQKTRSLPGTAMLIEFSPDGRRLAALGDDGFQLWNTDKWEVEATLPGKPHYPWPSRHTLAFSPASEFVVTPYHDAKYKDDWFQVWKLPEMELVSGCQAFGMEIASAAFLPDGKHLVTGLWDGTVLIWDLTTGQAITTLKAHNAWVSAIAVAPDSTLFATASADRSINIWDAATQKKDVEKLRGHLGEIWSLAWLPDSHTLVSGSFDGTVKLWDSATHQAEDTLEGVGIIAGFTDDSRFLVTASHDGATVWNLSTNQGNEILMGGSEPYDDNAHRLAVYGNELTSAIGKTNGSVEIWSLSTRTCRAAWQAHSSATNAVAFSPDGKRLCTASRGGDVVVWDPSTQREIARLASVGGPVFCVTFSPDGKLLAISGQLRENVIRVWDLDERRELAELRGHRNYVPTVAFSPDGKLLASVSGDNTARLWEIPSGKLHALLEGHVAGVDAVAFSPDGKTLATSGTNVKLWNIATHQEVTTLPTPNTVYSFSIKFSPDGGILAAGYRRVGGGVIRLWRAPSWQTIRDAGPVSRERDDRN